MTTRAKPDVPPWHSPFAAIRLIARGFTFHTASRVSLVVGTLLSTVNQGAIILHGNGTAATWIRVAVNYLVPFTVASIGYLAPFRAPRAAVRERSQISRSDG